MFKRLQSCFCCIACMPLPAFHVAHSSALRFNARALTNKHFHCSRVGRNLEKERFVNNELAALFISLFAAPPGWAPDSLTESIISS